MITEVDAINAFCLAVKLVPERSTTLGLADPSIYYRISKNDYGLESNASDKQQGCQNIPDPISSSNLTERLLRWFRPVESIGGIDEDRDGFAGNFRSQRRRSKSQPPQQHQQRLTQLMHMDPRFVQSPMEAPFSNTPKQNE